MDLVYFKLEDGDRPIDITQLSIQGETETVVIDVPANLITESTTWEEFVDLANKQINIQFGNIDGTTGELFKAEQHINTWNFSMVTVCLQKVLSCT